MLDGSSLLIMDLLGELEDGSLVNIEIQKQGYYFPAERISCYSSDMIMRQYTRARGLKGNAFTYRDVKKAYAIILFEESTAIFHAVPDHYIHYGKTVFHTGLPMELLQEFCFVALDVFQNFPYAKDKNEQTAWLSLLTTENLSDAEALIAEYPWVEEIYQEIAMLRQSPEEVLSMFSEALRILDQNTVKYMIDDMKAIIQEKEAALQEQSAVLQEQSAALQEKDADIAALKEHLEKLSQSSGQ